jgi:hypothetical protein
MAATSVPLTQRPEQDAKVLIGKLMLREDFEAADLQFYERYFQYYEKELALLNFGSMVKVLQTTPLAAKTHDDITYIVATMRTNQDFTKAELRQCLARRFLGAQNLAIDRSVDLGVRLWTMINVRETELKLLAPQTEPVPWESTVTVRDLLLQAVPKSRWQISAKDSRLHPSFTAAFMTSICGLRLEWTDCLADHLRLDRREKALRIYPFKSVLQCRLEEARSKAASRPA